MPDSLVTWIGHRRSWLVWWLALVLAFGQLVGAYGLAAAEPSARESASTDSVAHSSVLPKWFSLTRTRDVDATPDAVTAAQIVFMPRRSLPGWFVTAAQPSSLFQVSPSLTKRASVFEATIDQVFTYTLVFTIPANTTLTDVRLEDYLPDNSPNSEPRIHRHGTAGNYTGPTPLTPDTPSISPEDVSFCGSGDDYLCWDLPNIVNSSDQPYVYQMTYQAAVQSSGTSRGEVGTNEATLSWEIGSVTDAADVTIVAPNLTVKRIAFTAAGERAERPGSDASLLDLRANEIITITVLVTNVADTFVSSAYDLEIVDQWPEWVDYVDIIAGPAPDEVQGDQALWTASVLGVGEVFAVNYRAVVTSSVAPGLREDRNTEAYYRYLPGGSSNPRASAGRISFRSPAIAVVKTVQDEPPDQGRVVVGEVVTYTVVYTLPAGTTVYDPTFLEDQLDDGLRFMGVVTQPVEVTAFDVDETGDSDTILTWDITAPLKLDEDLRHTFVITAQVSPTYFLGSNAGQEIPKGTDLRNRALLRWDRGPWAGSASSGWSQNVSVRLARPQINPQKTKDAPADVFAGAGIPVRFELRNIRNGDGLSDAYAEPAYNVTITDTLPEGWVFEGSVPAGVTSTIGSRTVITWQVTPVLTVGWYLPGPSMTEDWYVVTATPPATVVVGALYTNSVEVSYASAQGYRYVDRSDLQMQLPLGVSKEITPTSPYLVGETVTYSLVAVMPPHSILYWSHHKDTLPRGVRYAGWYEVTGGTLLSEPVTGTENRRETLEWWWNSVDNSGSDDPLSVTFRFEGVLTGVDTDDILQWTGYDDAQEVRNTSELEWNTENISGTYSPWTLTEVDRTSGADEVIQPYLVHGSALPVKTLMGGGLVGESGDLITYSLAVSNIGLAPAFDLIISDTLPPGLVFRSYQAQVYPATAVGRPAYVPVASVAPAMGQQGTIGWVFDEIAEGDGDYRDSNTRLVITYTVGVTDSVGAGAALTNSAWISDYSSLPGDQPFERHYSYLSGMDNLYSADPVFVPEAQISKTASVTEVAIGDIVVFTVTVPDPKLGATMYNVAITDTMTALSPAQTLHVLGAAAPGATSLSVTSATVSADYISIPARLQATILITARVPVTAIGGQVQNAAAVTWEDAASGGSRHGDASEPVTLTIIAPDIQVSKNAAATVPPGHLLMYTIVYENSGTADAERVRLTDTLPVSFTFVQSRTNRPITALLGLPTTLVWELGTLKAGERGIVWVTGTVWPTATLGSSLINRVTVDTSSLGDNPANNQDTATTLIEGALLEIAKTAIPDPVAAGGQVFYTLVVTNNGTQATQNFLITDQLPLSTTFLAASSSGSLVDRVVVWNPADIGIGAQAVITFAVLVDPAVVSGTQIINAAYGAVADNAGSTVRGIPVTVVVHDAQLAISKVAAPDPVAAGALLRYVLTVNNLGDVEALGVVVTDRVPLSTTFDSASSGGSLLGDVVSWAPVKLGVSDQRVITFAVRVESPLVSGTWIINDDYGATADNAPRPSTAPVTVVVQSQPALFIEKAAAAVIDSGENLVYRILYRNTGNAVANNVRITERYDSNVTFIGAVPSPDSGNNVWQIGSLGPDGDHTIVITVQVAERVANGTQLTNTVLINSNETEPLSDTASTLVGGYLAYMPILMKAYGPQPPAADVNLTVQSVQVGPEPSTVGAATRITVTLYNSGTDAITGDFWVDLYIDPTTTPTINVLWNDIASRGKAWLIHDDIPGGGWLIIHTDQPDDPADPEGRYSNWPGWFESAGEHVLYVQVDSYDAFGLNTGAVLETDETDNVNGPVSVTTIPGDVLLPPSPAVQWRERR